MTESIHVENLTKVYRNFARREGLFGAIADLFKREYILTKAVDSVSFSIAEGEIVGYIGANGAGKSTTIKMLTGILRPTSGGAVINGLVPWEQRKKHARNIGVIFGQRTQLYWDIAVIETFNLLRRVYRVEKSVYDRRLEELTTLLDLSSLLTKPTRKLSLGQRMRCDFAASMIHDPPVLFFDEPTIGLDVSAKFRVRDAIRHLASDRGKTILLTTHDIADVEDLCERIIIVDGGRIIFDGLIRDIKDRMGRTRRATIDFHGEVSTDEISRLLDGRLLESEQITPEQVEIRFDIQSIKPSDLVRTLLAELPVKDIVLKGPDLSDIVRRIYEGKERLDE
ncbi:MAG: ATP-binding cassette domain-containing protein [Candidatus Coatesbacteria bacterium]|nr:ATP-binding cassette domain-containing protein [Candidatus Coatesbacteria bacterium]